jgi:hypothetical protein
MGILGLKIGLFRSGGKKRRKTTTRMERVASAGLLEAANRDPKVLFEIINKYGQIREYDKSESELQSIEERIYQKAVRNMLKGGNRELDAWINEIIDRVMGIKSGEYGRGYTPVPVRQRPDIKQGHDHGSGLPAFLRDPEIIAILGKLAGRKGKHKGERR